MSIRGDFRNVKRFLERVQQWWMAVEKAGLYAGSVYRGVA